MNSALSQKHDKLVGVRVFVCLFVLKCLPLTVQTRMPPEEAQGTFLEQEVLSVIEFFL